MIEVTLRCRDCSFRADGHFEDDAKFREEGILAGMAGTHLRGCPDHRLTYHHEPLEAADQRRTEAASAEMEQAKQDAATFHDRMHEKARRRAREERLDAQRT